MRSGTANGPGPTLAAVSPDHFSFLLVAARVRALLLFSYPLNCYKSTFNVGLPTGINSQRVSLFACSVMLETIPGMNWVLIHSGQCEFSYFQGSTTFTPERKPQDYWLFLNETIIF